MPPAIKTEPSDIAVAVWFVLADVIKPAEEKVDSVMGVDGVKMSAVFSGLPSAFLPPAISTLPSPSAVAVW